MSFMFAVGLTKVEKSQMERTQLKRLFIMLFLEKWDAMKSQLLETNSEEHHCYDLSKAGWARLAGCKERRRRTDITPNLKYLLILVWELVLVLVLTDWLIDWVFTVRLPLQDWGWSGLARAQPCRTGPGGKRLGGRQQHVESWERRTETGTGNGGTGATQYNTCQSFTDLLFTRTIGPGKTTSPTNLCPALL